MHKLLMDLYNPRHRAGSLTWAIRHLVGEQLVEFTKHAATVATATAQDLDLTGQLLEKLRAAQGVGIGGYYDPGTGQIVITPEALNIHYDPITGQIVITPEALDIDQLTIPAGATPPDKQAAPPDGQAAPLDKQGVVTFGEQEVKPIIGDPTKQHPPPPMQQPPKEESSIASILLPVGIFAAILLATGQKKRR